LLAPVSGVVVDSIVDLLEVHLDFAAGLRRVREAVMDRRFRTASAELDWLRRALSKHMEGEETLLFPWYEGLDVPTNGDVSALARDHRAIEAHLQVRLHGREPVRLADELSLFSGLLEHHDEREARWFKPRVDEVIPTVEKRSILAWFEESMPALPPRTQDEREEIATPDLEGLAACRFALATGQIDIRAIAALSAGHAKEIRLRDRAVTQLESGDRLAAYDTLRLLHLLATALGSAEGPM